MLEECINYVHIKAIVTYLSVHAGVYKIICKSLDVLHAPDFGKPTKL